MTAWMLLAAMSETQRAQYGTMWLGPLILLVAGAGYLVNQSRWWNRRMWDRRHRRDAARKQQDADRTDGP